MTLDGGTVALPSEIPVNLTGPQPSAVLNNLSAPLPSGGYVKVTLQFKNAGPVTLQVPVEPQSYYWATYSPAPSAPASVPGQHPGRHPRIHRGAQPDGDAERDADVTRPRAER